MSEETLSKVRQILEQYDDLGPSYVAKRAKLSKTHAWYCLDKLCKLGEVERDEGKYHLKRPSFERHALCYFKRHMPKCDWVAYAPFCPIIGGAHAILSGSPGLLYPLNAYVAVGVRKEDGNAGRIRVPEAPHVSHSVRGTSFTLGIVEKTAQQLSRVIFDNIKTKKKLPNLSMIIYSTIDLAQGCGGSAALSVAATLALLGALGEISCSRLREGTKEFDMVYRIAYKTEQVIHGKEELERDFGEAALSYAAPYSSGSSMLGSILGSPPSTNNPTRTALYKYEIANRKRLKEDKDPAPVFKKEVVENRLPDSSELFFVLGRSKLTKECFRKTIRLKEDKILSEEFYDSLFKAWKDTANGLIEGFKEGSEKKVAELLKVQNGFYSVLDLHTEEFSRLFGSFSGWSEVGASLIGGGMGGACIIFAAKDQKEAVKQKIFNDSSLFCLPHECLKPSGWAKLIEMQESDVIKRV